MGFNSGFKGLIGITVTPEHSSNMNSIQTLTGLATMLTIIFTYYYLLGFETVQFCVCELAFHVSGIPPYYVHPNN